MGFLPFGVTVQGGRVHGFPRNASGDQEGTSAEVPNKAVNQRVIKSFAFMCDRHFETANTRAGGGGVAGGSLPLTFSLE